MSERTVAEIMGWERAADYDEERWVDPIDHVAWLPGSGYDCDDMLAWLLEHQWVVEVLPMHPHFDDQREVVVTHHNRGVCHECGASTLHAALEAAVRAVADAE